MPFTIQGSEPLTAVVNVRLTPGEKERLKDDAELAGVSVSELVRRRYFGRPLVASADMVIVRELRRLGGLLKHVHNESKGVYSTLTASVIAELRKAIEKLSQGVKS
jgi:hypothetical protein